MSKIFLQDGSVGYLNCPCVGKDIPNGKEITVIPCANNTCPFYACLNCKSQDGFGFYVCSKRCANERKQRRTPQIVVDLTETEEEYTQIPSPNDEFYLYLDITL